MSKSWPGEMPKQICKNKAADVESCFISLFSSVTEESAYILPSVYGCKLVQYSHDTINV